MNIDLLKYLMKLLNILLIITTIFISITEILYVKLVIIDNLNVEIYMKWIPTFVLYILCAYSTWINRKNSHKKIYSFLLALGYAFCMIGDILIIYKYPTSFVIALIFFMNAYISFGSARILNIYHYRNKEYFCSKLLLSIFIGISIIIPINYYLCNSIDNQYVCIATIVYSLSIIYALIITFFHVILKPNMISIFSLVGIIGFMISDIIIDINLKINYIEIIIMLIYWSSINIIAWSLWSKHNHVIHI